MTAARLAVAVAAVGLALLVFPDSAHAWTPGTHIYLGESILANLAMLPPAIADLLRAYPFDFLYGNIAADSSIAKSYAPLGRHCHYWHVGQEIHDLAESDAMRAFGLGYLSHLAADAVAHNYFVPRQLMLTSSTSAVGHSYWETRVEAHLGDAYARAAKDVILLDHSEADAHLDRLIAPTIFSVRTNRRLFRGMVRLTETTAGSAPARWPASTAAGVWPSRTSSATSASPTISWWSCWAAAAWARTSSTPRASGRSNRPRSCAGGCSAPPGDAIRRACVTKPRSTSACPIVRWRTGPASPRSSPGGRRRARRPRPRRW